MEQTTSQRGPEGKRTGATLLETRKLVKTFPGVIANNSIDFDLRAGEVHGIVGENGAGKSTFCNLLTGVYTPDQGKILFEGKEVVFTHPSQAIDMGVRMVHQERNLVPFLTGTENICLNSESTSWGVVRAEAESEKVATIMKDYGINVDVDIPVFRLSPSDQQLVEIMRAVLYDPKVLILDEPTASLGDESVLTLFGIINELRTRGIGIIYISHKLEEVFSLCDRVSIFRDGMKVTTEEKDSLDRDRCISLMVNRELKSRYPSVVPHRMEEKALEVIGASDKESFLNDINLEVHKGEVVGVYGLVGCGRTELAELIYGLRPIESGEIVIEGGVSISPQDSVKDRISKGIWMVPEDRMQSGLFGNFNLLHNLSISFLEKVLNQLGVVNTGKERALAQDVADSPKLELKYVSLNQSPMNLSGGNKQKVLLGRMLVQDSRVVILDEPTKGIDVGAKYQIYQMIRSLAEEGKGVVFISSELPELTGVCDRICVMKAGQVVGEVARTDFDDERILSMCF